VETFHDGSGTLGTMKRICKTAGRSGTIDYRTDFRGTIKKGLHRRLISKVESRR
jgi:hypothetical protein